MPLNYLLWTIFAYNIKKWGKIECFLNKKALHVASNFMLRYCFVTSKQATYGHDLIYVKLPNIEWRSLAERALFNLGNYQSCEKFVLCTTI